MKGGLALIGAVLLAAGLLGFAVYGLWAFAMVML